jgi:hypothetical protein
LEATAQAVWFVPVEQPQLLGEVAVQKPTMEYIVVPVPEVAVAVMAPLWAVVQQLDVELGG